MITVIDKAKELVNSIGKEEAIKFFQNEIEKFGKPKNFAEMCKITGFETAIEFIQGR